MMKNLALIISLTLALSACSKQATDFVKGASSRSRTQPSTSLSDDPRGVRFSGGQGYATSSSLSMTVNTGQAVLRTTGGGGTLSATVGLSRSPTSQ